MKSLSGPAPIVVFAYMRPVHLARTIESLQRNAEAASSHLYVYCDAAKRLEHAEAVEAVRAYADKIQGFASVQVIKRERNMGLAASVIDGVTQVVEAHERLIVVEDDLLLSPHFLRYMNDALECYKHDSEVASIHGYCYPIRQALPETFFLRGADCWGWATWRRAWKAFRPDGRVLLRELKDRSLTREFDLDSTYPFTQMLRDQIDGRNDSWAVRWHASCFLAGMVTLYPGRSLVHNIGNDGSGTHMKSSTTSFDQEVAEEPVRVHRLAIEESTEARNTLIAHLRSRHRNRWISTARHFLSRVQHLGTRA